MKHQKISTVITSMEKIAGAGLLMGDDISLGLLSMAVCFDFCSTNVVQLSMSSKVA